MAKKKESPRVHKFIERVKKHIKADPEYKPLVSHIPGLADPLLYHPLYPPGFNTHDEEVEQMRWTKAVRRDAKVRLFAFKELLGTINEDFSLEEWAVWTRFKLLMSACPFKPFLKLDNKEGMDDDAIADMLSVPVELWLVTKRKLERLKRIVVTRKTNVIWIPTWGSTQDPRELPVTYLKSLTDKMLEGGEGEVHYDEDELDEAKFIREVTEYLNLKSGKHYTLKSVASNRHINARRREGATIENFKHVIDVKCQQWIGTTMEIFIRPLTLFNSEKFWGYANEPLAKKKVEVGSNAGYWSEFTKEERSLITYLTIEYNKLLNKTLKLSGVDRFEQLPEGFLTQDSWIKEQLYERRKKRAKESAEE
jgi:uncharacterized phage protein (TIGR02220 family)